MKRYETNRAWYKRHRQKVFPVPTVCDCGATYLPRAGGQPQKWCRRDCPARKESLRKRSRLCYQKRKPAYLAQLREYVMNNPGKIRAWQLKKYGITPDDYAALHAAQEGRCAICRSDKPSKRRVFFDVDHCHTTGVVRGLLCEVCNRSIGLMKDDPALLRRAAEYLELAPSPVAGSSA